MSGFRPETETAIAAVEQALAVAAARTGAHDVRFKGDRDLVTATDVAVEDILRGRLGPNVVGEERGGASNDSAYWLVDPICGTRNFASSIPLYCVNVALVEAGEVVVAVVGDPPAGEIFVAEKGRGAWAWDRGGWSRLEVDDGSATIVIEDSHADPDPSRRERGASMLAGATTAFRWDVRAFGSSLALPYVAAGRVSAYVLFWTTAVHVAAGSLLVTEARGTVSDIDGNPWSIASDSLVASATPALHAALLSL